MTQQRAFTLIELMVVVAVIAILATLAVPSMQDRSVRDQIVEAAKLADLAKAPIAAAWATTAILPADNAAAGGNKRGANAVDWQTERSAAGSVASGQRAVVGGGYNSSALGQSATVGGGQNRWHWSGSSFQRRGQRFRRSLSSFSVRQAPSTG